MSTTPPSAVPSPQVFLSHATEDQDWVSWVAAQADALGLRPYVAEHDFQLGRELVEKVREQIDRSEAMIALLTEAGYQSPFVQQEIAYAIAKDLLVIPIIAPSIVGSDLAMLAGREYLVLDFDDPAQAVAPLIATLTQLANNWAARQGAAIMAPTHAAVAMRVQPGQVEIQVSNEALLIGAATVVLIALILAAGREGGGAL
jgi:hypothetical protein